MRQIITSIGATIRTAGVVEMENSKRMAWLSVEIPSKDGTRGTVLENFRGVPCRTGYEAEENVSELISNFPPHVTFKYMGQGYKL